MRWLLAFARFWYDFIVGDSAALAVGGVAVLALGALLVRAGGAGLGQLLLPVAVGLTLTVSLRLPR